MRHPFTNLAWLTGSWSALLLVQLIRVVVQRPQASS
jgi:hypothetical protein